MWINLTSLCALVKVVAVYNSVYFGNYISTDLSDSNTTRHGAYNDAICTSLGVMLLVTSNACDSVALDTQHFI